MYRVFCFGLFCFNGLFILFVHLPLDPAGFFILGDIIYTNIPLLIVPYKAAKIFRADARKKCMEEFKRLHYSRRVYMSVEHVIKKFKTFRVVVMSPKMTICLCCRTLCLVIKKTCEYNK